MKTRLFSAIVGAGASLNKPRSVGTVVLAAAALVAVALLLVTAVLAAGCNADSDVGAADDFSVFSSADLLDGGGLRVDGPDLCVFPADCDPQCPKLRDVAVGRTTCAVPGKQCVYFEDTLSCLCDGHWWFTQCPFPCYPGDMGPPACDGGP